MTERPGSLPEFEVRFPDEAACARWLFGKRWPDGFRCPGCGHAKGWELGHGKLPVAGAVEIRGKGPGRVRLVAIEDYSAATLTTFVAGNVASGSTVVSDGWSGYARLRDVKHEPTVIGDTPAHLILPWIHRVFANAKRWALGVYHGLRPAHLQAYRDEFVSRFNRRSTPAAAFERLLGI